MRHCLAIGLGVVMLVLAPVGAGSSAANTWAGTWNTDFGPLIMTAGGSGTYYEGKGKLSGTIKGNVLEGKWAQPERTGGFKFTMSADGRSFTGVWNYEGETAMTAGWSGTCAAGPCLKNGTAAPAPATPSANTKTVAAPAPGGTRAVASPKPLPTSKKVGVKISSSKCRSTSSLTPRTRAITASCSPGPGTTVVGEGGVRRERIGRAVAACWLIGPTGLRFKGKHWEDADLRKGDISKFQEEFDKITDGRLQLFYCLALVSTLVSTDEIDLAARKLQATSSCSATRIVFDGRVRSGRLTSLRVVSGKPGPTDVRYGCSVSGDALNVSVDGRTAGGLRKALGNKLDLGVVRAKKAEPDGAKLTFKFGW